MDLKSNLLWAIASVALIMSTIFVDTGNATQSMADLSEISSETTG